MNQPKIERILKLMALLAGNRKYTYEELAEKLEITERSVYRYIDTFYSAGFSFSKQAGYSPRLVKIDGIKDFSNIVYFSEEEAFVMNRLFDSIDPHNALKAGLHRLEPTSVSRG